MELLTPVAGDSTLEDDLIIKPQVLSFSTESMLIDEEGQNVLGMDISLKKTPNGNQKVFFHWTTTEEVVLTGVVMNQYFRRHSLKPTKEEQTVAAREKTRGEESVVWSMIHAEYETACSRLNLLYLVLDLPKTGG